MTVHIHISEITSADVSMRLCTFQRIQNWKLMFDDLVILQGQQCSSKSPLCYRGGNWGTRTWEGLIKAAWQAGQGLWSNISLSMNKWSVGRSIRNWVLEMVLCSLALALPDNIKSGESAVRRSEYVWAESQLMATLRAHGHTCPPSSTEILALSPTGEGAS